MFLPFLVMFIFAFSKLFLKLKDYRDCCSCRSIDVTVLPLHNKENNYIIVIF